MPYLFKDLIVTLLPDGGLGPLEAADGGGTAGGGCTTSCAGIDFECGDSGEVIEIGPYSAIDPAFQLELRQLIIYGLTANAVPVAEPARLEVVEEQMRPRTRRGRGSRAPTHGSIPRAQRVQGVPRRGEIG